MRFFKKLKKFCGKSQNPDNLNKEMYSLGKNLNRLHDGLIKNSETIESLVEYNLKEVYSTMENTVNPLYKSLLLSKESTSAEWGELKENYEKLRTAQKIIGEVIGKGGADDE